jgi:predicted Zn-dependent protease
MVERPFSPPAGSLAEAAELSRSGQVAEAAAMAVRLAMEPNSSLDCYLAAVRYLLELKEARIAARMLQPAAPRFDIQPDYWVAVARVQMALGNAEAAKAMLARCVALEPERRLELLSDRAFDSLWL